MGTYSRSPYSTNRDGVVATYWLFGPPRERGGKWEYLGSISIKKSYGYTDIPVGAKVLLKGTEYRVKDIIGKNINKHGIPVISIQVYPTSTME